ncbi:MAG: Flp family type IVb pilin [Candidatus Melainabacteria bacterium]|nr:Flp family type IVb pilin [Candidatus Melainabacteria bacterium]MBI3307899.1 Flp family type IVb pilin [Candidatus Melainabacteria bacterium]
MNTIANFIRDEEGASMAEYALLVGLIAVALIAAITAFRGSIINTFTRVTNALNAAQ